MIALSAEVETGQPAPATATIQPLSIQPEPWPIKPGDSLSARSLVTHPPVVRGVLSWTIETRRHRGYVYGLAVSPDGQQVATSGLEGTIRIWSVPEGKLLRVLVGHPLPVISIAWSPCGTVIASSGSSDGTVRLWEVRTGRLLRRLRGLKSPMGYVAWSPDGTKLATAGGHSGMVQLWSSSGEKLEKLVEVGQPVGHLDWAPDNKRLTFGVSQSPLSVFDLDAQKVVQTFDDPPNRYHMGVWSPDGRHLAAGSTQHLAVWDPAKPEPLCKLDGYCYWVAWSPDGRLLAVASGNAVRIWEPATGKTIRQWPSAALRLQWHPGSGRLFALSYVGLNVWNVTDGKEVCNLELSGVTPPFWTPNRPLLTGLGTATLAVWDGNTAKFLGELKGQGKPFSGAAWSRDGKTLAVAAADGTILLWDSRLWQLRQTLKGHKGAVTALAWSSSGSTLATAATDRKILIWDAEGQLLATLDINTGCARTLNWAPAGGVLVSGDSDLMIRVWSTKTQDVQRSIKVRWPISSVAATSVNKVFTVACGTSNGALLCNAATGETLAHLGMNAAWGHTLWLPAAGLLAVGRDHGVQVWDTAANKVVLGLDAMAPVYRIGFTANGAILAAETADRTVRFWDSASKQLRGAILAERGHLLMISSDGFWRVDGEKQPDIVLIARTEEGLLALSPTEFGERFRWKNPNTRVRLFPQGR